MKPSEILAFLRPNRWAIEASSSLDGMPQAAIVGFAVTDQLKLILKPDQPRWIRFSDFTVEPPLVFEQTLGPVHVQ
jgi:hypothetical protein